MAVTVNDAKNETIENEWMLQENTYEVCICLFELISNQSRVIIL